jgi:hypothetical protein
LLTFSRRARRCSRDDALDHGGQNYALGTSSAPATLAQPEGASFEQQQQDESSGVAIGPRFRWMNLKKAFLEIKWA